MKKGKYFFVYGIYNPTRILIRKKDIEKDIWSNTESKRRMENLKNEKL
jgi:hypothetical protein